MEIDQFVHNPNIFNHLQALRIQVELKLRKNIRATRSLEEFRELLSTSFKSNHSEIVEARKKLVETLTPWHLSFLKTQGFHFGDNGYLIPRSEQSQTGAPPKTSATESKATNKKQKIVYRGQAQR